MGVKEAHQIVKHQLVQTQAVPTHWQLSHFCRCIALKSIDNINYISIYGIQSPQTITVIAYHQNIRPIQFAN